MKSQYMPVPVYGLKNLISEVTPTLINWDNNPTNSENLTDGDMSTVCDTGNIAAAAYENATFEWDLKNCYNFMTGGFGGVTKTAGTWIITLDVYNNGVWKGINSVIASSSTSGIVEHFSSILSKGSKIRLHIYTNAISTNTPKIHQFFVWRLQ